MESEPAFPSEYTIKIKNDARVIVRANKKAKDGVEIKLRVSDKRAADVCDYETWLSAARNTDVVALARDQILQHCSIPSDTAEESGHVGTFLDQTADLNALHTALDSLKDGRSDD